MGVGDLQRAGVSGASKRFLRVKETGGFPGGIGNWKEILNILYYQGGKVQHPGDVDKVGRKGGIKSTY